MDLDDLGKPSQAPSRIAKFAPKASKLKPQPKLKTELSREPVSVPKTEPQNLPIIKKIEDEINDKPSANAASAKVELAAAEAASSSLPKQEDGMDIDGDDQKQDEDTIVREIHVYFTPSVDDNTGLCVMQYPLRACWRPYELDERCEELRPSLEHLRSCGSKGKTNITSDAEYTVKVEDLSEGKPVGPSKKQNKRMDLANEQKSDVEEYHDSRSGLSSSYLQKMVAKESPPLEFAMSPYNYISSLCPGNSDGNAGQKVPSRRFLLSLPLEERIKRLFLEGPPTQRFDALKHYAPGVLCKDLLTVLQKYGQLVQGLWVPKTSLLFPNATTAMENIKVAARNYVLILFGKNSVIGSSELNFAAKFREEMKNFLSIFAVERASSKDWEFKERKDKSFIELYPEIAAKQDQIWKDMEQKITCRLQRGKSGSGAKTATARPPAVRNAVRSVNVRRSQ